MTGNCELRWTNMWLTEASGNADQMRIDIDKIDATAATARLRPVAHANNRKLIAPWPSDRMSFNEALLPNGNCAASVVAASTSAAISAVP